jgi:hypothetical protein
LTSARRSQRSSSLPSSSLKETLRRSCRFHRLALWSARDC